MANETADTKTQINEPPLREPRSGPLLTTGTLLLAGAVAFGVVMLTEHLNVYPHFEMGEEFEKIAEIEAQNHTPEQIQQLRAENARVLKLNQILATGVYGLVCGVFLGLAEGISRKSVLRILLGVLVIGLLGAGFGALGGYAANQLRMNYEPVGEAIAQVYSGAENSNDLIRVILMQMVMFGILGFGLGLGFGVTALKPGAVLKCAFSSLLGAILIGFVYTVGTSYLLPTTNTNYVFPEDWELRLVWLGIGAVLLGITVCGLSMSRRKKAAA